MIPELLQAVILFQFSQNVLVFFIPLEGILAIPTMTAHRLLTEDWARKAVAHQKNYKRLLQRSDKNALLDQLPELHEEAISKIDCLTCGACCKQYSPRFKTPDIKRISKNLRLKESVFIETYLTLDEEGDYVVRSTPCPFLGADNRCSIYEVRPSDCQRFPYTDEDVLFKRPALTLKNATFCPITYYVLERLLEQEDQLKK